MRLSLSKGENRSSALWGRRTDERASALWGRGGRGAVAAVAGALLLTVPMLGSAATRDGDRGNATVPAGLLKAAAASPGAMFDVIVQGNRGRSSREVADAVVNRHGKPKKQFESISGVAAQVSGEELLDLARDSHVGAITRDVPLQAAAYEDSTMWRQTVNVFGLYAGGMTYGGGGIPSIAIVDSGIQDRKEFPKILAHVNLAGSSLLGAADGQGHGTMVAGITAGGGKYGGAAQSFPLLDLRTADAQGKSLTSDVIAACDWILANKAKYNIRVANFSMSGNVESSFTNDPLDKAVEKLWVNGVVVVAAAGNQGTGNGPVPLSAPANDPFVITVGAVDQHSTSSTADDTLPPWSAFGHTLDGFQKPELAAPGRYLIAPVPVGSSLFATFPERIVDPAGGLMWMSGTSFAAPIVSGAAAQILYRHPDWTPGQVKGALMLTARALRLAGLAGGVGEPDVSAAAALASPPNANENLDAFVAADPGTGQPAFNVANWAAAVSSAANWSTANWTGANWTAANWSTANWATANWTTANWATANWTTANWAAANWTDAGQPE